jgi:glutamate racemase
MIPKIGVFDSGIGGLGILKEIAKLLPSENLIYFSDNARHPYGDKSPQEIQHACRECASILLHQDISCLVIACHTASAYQTLSEELSIPVIDVIEPGIEALKATNGYRIAVLATSATWASGVYQKRLEGAQVIPCPHLASLIEKDPDHPGIDTLLEEYLEPLQCDSLLLACTHYPLIKGKIQAHLGESVSIVDSAQLTAKRVEQELLQRSLMRKP